MASLYSDEGFPLQVVEALRALGHDVLTALDAGQANRAVADEAVLDFATALDRALLTLNRWHFIGLHARRASHAGLIVCAQDPDVAHQTAAIDDTIRALPKLHGLLLRINRST